MSSTHRKTGKQMVLAFLYSKKRSRLYEVSGWKKSQKGHYKGQE